VRPTGVYCKRGCYKRNPYRSGKGRPNFPVGSKKTTNEGYVMVKVRPGNQGWEMEHRLVMEETLGRPLLLGETVHHKRPNSKHDNRPGNLELWVTHQPKGQRPEDIVEWAVEMLGRYAPERLAT
jgi:hypothetical protein